MPGPRPAFLNERWPSGTFATQNVTRHRTPSLCSAVLGQDSSSPCTSPSLGEQRFRLPVGEEAVLGWSMFLQVCSRERLGYATKPLPCCKRTHKHPGEDRRALPNRRRHTERPPSAGLYVHCSHPRVAAHAGARRHTHGLRGTRTQNHGCTHKTTKARTHARTRTHKQGWKGGH